MKRLALLFFPLLLTACASGGGQDAQSSGASAPAETETPVITINGGPSTMVQPSLSASEQNLLPSAPVVLTIPGATAAPVVPQGPRITYNGVSIASRHLAMTFDDGPHKTLTPQLLDLLARKRVRATFYVVGKNVEAYPEIAARIVREGHEIANHTWSHPSLTKISQESARSQFARTEKAIIDATGVKPRTMRPPYGAYNTRIANWVHSEFGYKNILWNVDPLDWKRPGPGVVAQRIVSGAKPGAIILAHDIHPGTIQAMPSAIDQLLAAGYQFVTVSELIAMESGDRSAVGDVEVRAGQASPAVANP